MEHHNSSSCVFLQPIPFSHACDGAKRTDGQVSWWTREVEERAETEWNALRHPCAMNDRVQPCA